jgi:hypothetical protein
MGVGAGVDKDAQIGEEGFFDLEGAGSEYDKGRV